MNEVIPRLFSSHSAKRHCTQFRNDFLQWILTDFEITGIGTELAKAGKWGFKTGIYPDF
jgi:hypothetical protein